MRENYRKLKIIFVIVIRWFCWPGIILDVVHTGVMVGRVVFDHTCFLRPTGCRSTISVKFVTWGKWFYQLTFTLYQFLTIN